MGQVGADWFYCVSGALYPNSEGHLFSLQDSNYCEMKLVSNRTIKMQIAWLVQYWV